LKRTGDWLSLSEAKVTGALELNSLVEFGPEAISSRVGTLVREARRTPLEVVGLGATLAPLFADFRGAV
jgi:hypothetical protein